MSWRLEVAASGDRSLARLPDKVAAAIVAYMLGPLRENPRRAGKPLGGEYKGYYSARRGSYRIVYRLDEATGTIYVVRVAHRADVYRSR